MIEDLNNPDLVDAVKHDENTSELERELADRLQTAIEEIEILVETITRLEAQYGVDA